MMMRLFTISLVLILSLVGLLLLVNPWAGYILVTIFGGNTCAVEGVELRAPSSDACRARINDYVVRAKDPSLCSKITFDYGPGLGVDSLRPECYAHYAVTTNDPAVCRLEPLHWKWCLGQAEARR